MWQYRQQNFSTATGYSEFALKIGRYNNAPTKLNGRILNSSTSILDKKGSSGLRLKSCNNFPCRVFLREVSAEFIFYPSAWPKLTCENSKGDTIKISEVKTMDPFRRSGMTEETVRQRLSSSELLLMPASPLASNRYAYCHSTDKNNKAIFRLQF